nr:cytochrome c oxidase subunit 2 [Strongylocotes lipogonus]
MKLSLILSSYLQDSASPLMFHISSFHDHCMMVLILIISTVAYIGVGMVSMVGFSRQMKSNETLEGVWTVIPCLILASLMAPSLSTLYMSEEASEPYLTMKVVGHQWYWSYEYGGSANLEFSSYMLPSSLLGVGDFRLLEVDSMLYLPMGVESRVSITSDDVIHAWTIPSMGMKVDAIPGRLNQLFSLPMKVGTYYGQCSEICGANHSFMPIVVEVIPIEKLESVLTFAD